jgi:Flp pilus assembly protein TadD
LERISIGAWFLVVWLIFCGVTAHLRNRVWKNELTLWSSVVVLSPEKVAPHLNLGNALLRRDVLVEAEQEYRTVLAINPLDSRAINGIAAICFRQENFAEAQRLFQILVNEKPEEPHFQNNLGVAFLRQGAFSEAEKHFRTAINLLPGYADAYNNLGLLYREQGMLREATEAFSVALGYDSNHIAARKYLNEIQSRDGEVQ